MIYIIAFALIIGLILQPKITLSLMGITVCLAFFCFTGEADRSVLGIDLFSSSAASKIRKVKMVNNLPAVTRLMDGDYANGIERYYNTWANTYNTRDIINSKWGFLKEKRPHYNANWRGFWSGCNPETKKKATYMRLSKYEYRKGGCIWNPGWSLAKRKEIAIQMILDAEKIKKWCRNN